MLPNFLCIGAQKAGTTTLYSILKQHPDIFLPEKIKETKFFVYEEKFEKGISYYEKEFFSEWNGEHAVGEVDPAMMYEPKAAERIFQSLGKNVKFIVIFRNPVSRAYSHYLMSQRKGFEKLSFEEAIDAETQRLSEKPELKFNYSYFTRGYYSQQIQSFLKFYAEKNFMFLIFEEDFIKRRKETFDHIQQFLGVQPFSLNLEIKSNEAASYKNEMVQKITRTKNPIRAAIGKVLPKTMRRSLHKLIEKENSQAAENARLDRSLEKKLIHEYFLNDIRELEKITRRNLGVWYD